MPKLNPYKIIYNFYDKDSKLCELLIAHSTQVKDKALEILANSNHKNIDETIVINGALLHDIGVFMCHAPKILCMGDKPYIAHGIIGAKLIREYGVLHDLDLEQYARICERHTGAGLIAEEIVKQQLPIPAKDYLPETLEEKLICLADKFFSKSGNMNEKSLDKIKLSMAKLGDGPLERFNRLCYEFMI